MQEEKSLERKSRDEKRREEPRKQAITLKIAGKSYPFTIESEKEEMYRLAEREVNGYLVQLRQQNIRNWSEQDYLAITALKFAIAGLEVRQSRELGADDLGRLAELDERIDAYMNSLGE